MSTNYTAIKDASLVLRALNHKLRQNIIEVIRKEKRITVTEIYVCLRLEQSVASQHLGILRKAGVVKTEREGKCIFYLVNEARIKQVETAAIELVSVK